MCLNAGYSGEQCIEASDIMERLALDMGDFDIVCGPEEAVGDQAHPHWSAKVRHWAWQRWRGYLPICERKAALLAMLEAEGR